MKFTQIFTMRNFYESKNYHHNKFNQKIEFNFVIFLTLSLMKCAK